MAHGRPLAPLTLSPTERGALVSITRAHSMPQALATRARIVLAAADGRSNTEIAETLGLSKPTVGIWRKRYLTRRLPGLYDEPRPGGPRSIRDEEVAALIRKTLRTKPKHGTHWSCRSIATQLKLSKSTVQRIWKAFGLQSHRQKHFKISTDPFFAEKVHDIVGLYLNPPDHAVVLCVDEKSQIQALDRTQPLLPFGLGYVDGVAYGDVRYGTTTLFAALDIAPGKVQKNCIRRHRHQEFLRFLRYIETSVPRALDVHLIVHNHATHKHATLLRWVAAHPRFHVHCAPTYSSWLNQVEVWFNIITQRAIRRGTFRSVRDLVTRIERFVKHHNHHCLPFSWTATSDSILEKTERLCEAVAGAAH